jgi:hydrogenase small subunit
MDSLLSPPRPPSILDRAFDRRAFLKVCTLAAAAVGLPASAAARFAETVAAGKKPPVVWLHFQECTGCSETLLRPEHPALDELILDLISLDYHETLMVPSGHMAEKVRMDAMNANKGKFILVVEGAIPTKENGIYCQVGGKTALKIVEEAAEMAGAVIAIGSCASFGGLPAADPNPTGAKGVPEILAGKTVVTIPGCPPNPYNFLGTALQYASFGTLPALDEKGRPKFAYGRTIHEHCPRRAHFDAGRFAEQYGDEGHKQGWCLYKLGCKGPETHANCSTQSFAEVNDCWPIGIGHPCYGCTEQTVLWQKGLHELAAIDRPVPPAAYAPVHAERGVVSPLATAVAGVVAGAVVGGGFAFSKKLDKDDASGSGEGV